jgi:MGT family glycosyltransferase
MATILFFPEGAFGPTNNCIGIGDVLRGRGHRVVFLVEESFAGTLEARGFEERLMRLAPPPDTPEVPGQFWKDFVRDTSPVFRRPTIEALEGFVAPTFQALCDGAAYVDPRLREVLDELDPDVVVEDNVVAFPAISAAARPWVRIMSCNPLELPDPDLPPVFSGYPTGNREGWAEFRAEARRTLGDLHAGFDTVCRELGAPALPDMEFLHASPWLNLSLYPDEVDYPRSRPVDATWHDLQTCVRDSDGPWTPPDGDGPLVYLSLGSLGSADLGLMQHLVDALAGAPYRVVVSMGPLHEQLRLPAGMTGAEFLPQASLLPQVDLVITHGGNNTVTECLHHGKPMVVLPLFWDQFDNAQRVDETGFGRRLPTYECGRDELVTAIDDLLADRELAGRLAAVSGRVRATPGTRTAADLVEAVAATREPVRATAAGRAS